MLRTLAVVLTLVSPPFLKPSILRGLLGARIGRHVRIGWLAAVSARHIDLGDYAEIRSLTFVSLDGDLRLGAYSIISSFTLVYGAASLLVGEHSYIGPQSLVNAEESVSIGHHSAVGPRSMIYTHGSFLPYTEGYWVSFGPVTLGDYVWCAAGVFIRPGVTIGDRVFVNSRSVVTGDVAPGEVVDGHPARVVTTIDRLTRSMPPERLDSAAARILAHFGEVVVARRFGVEVHSEPGRLSFTYRGRRYFVICAPSAAADAARLQGTRVVALVTRPGWPGTNLPGVLALDLTTLLAVRHRDPVFHELDVFLRRYYGVQFRYR